MEPKASASEAPLPWYVKVWRWITGYAPPPPLPAPVKPAPVAPKSYPALAATFGNIAPVPSETEDPLPKPNRHIFPDKQSPETRFEDLNWRLFLINPAKELNWPPSRVSDYATEVFGETQVILGRASLTLRPYYPIIFDPGGAWAWASRQIEINPDYSDPIIDAYLEMPRELRPVVLSVKTGRPVQQADNLTFIRYGFEPFTLSFESTIPYVGDCLSYAMKALTGSREDWLWFSVARMRKHVTERNQAMDAVRAFLETNAAEREADESRNRFAALWGLRDVTTNEVAALDETGAPTS